MRPPIHVASIHEVMGDPQVAGLSGFTTGNNGEPPNDPSSGDTCSNYRVEIDTVGIKNLKDLTNRNSSVTVRTLIY